MGSKKRIIFWQNIISPHQIDFLKAISENYIITLVVDKAQDEYRKKDGWEIPDYSFLELYIRPNNAIIKQLFEDKQSVHVFSGIGSYKYVDKGFRKAVKLKAKIGLLSEPIKTRGVKGFLKLVKGNLQRLIYSNKIDFICTTGNLGVETYLKFGYNRKNIYQWGYFVESIITENKQREKAIVYVGQLVERKQIKEFTELFVSNNGLGYEKLNIIGKGRLKSELELIIKNNNNNCKINLLGRLNSQETFGIISKSSLLVIPSNFDGWGVVVNEALLCGTRVIASSNVGASVLLDGNIRGEVFEANNLEDLKRVLTKWSEKKLLLDDNFKIKKWAETNISPKVAANYFENIIDYVYNRKEKKPVAPWLK